MSDFATALLSPWAIAWLVKTDDWNHIERVIHHNCSLLGGYYNIMIPVSENLEIEPLFEALLSAYDPDYIVLSPGIGELPKLQTGLQPNPFQTVRWEHLAGIVSHDAMIGSNTQAAGVASHQVGTSRPNNAPPTDLIAIADKMFPDASRLALLACGDVLPGEHEFDNIGGTHNFGAIGYRERVLQTLTTAGNKGPCARIGGDGHIIPAPNRYELASILKKDNQFPLSGSARIIEACCELQHLPSYYACFINRTATRLRSGGWPPTRRFKQLHPTPGMAIIISDSFEFEEAVLFWNLRASQVLVCWISFSDLERELADVRDWLESDFGGSYYTLGEDIAFSARQSDEDRLEQLVSELIAKRSGDFPTWRTYRRSELVFYDYERPHLLREHIVVTRDGRSCSILAPYPESTFGSLALTLDWHWFMLPPRRELTELVSRETFGAYWPHHFAPGAMPLPRGRPRLRVAASRHIRLQLDGNSPVHFNHPTVSQMLQTLFESANLTRFQEGSHAQYQRAFIKRAGSLYEAGRLLKTSPYHELFALLSNCKVNRTIPGWLLKDPPRRALHQLALYKTLNLAAPDRTEEYFKAAESLPKEALELLKLDLMERGFQLSCSFCSSKLWYRAEEVGQVFKCHRCYEDQRVISNSLWLYKLPEVIYQGFNNDMQVPLLTLNCLLRRSKHNFDYALDFVVHTEGAKTKNVDFGCLSDGRVYVGEAKSNDYIDQEQFEFYELIASQTNIDGIVFATSATRWKPSTLERIEKLKARFTKGEVIVLHEAELYE